MTVYYNEFKPEAAAMLRQLIKDKLIADGEVDERSITEVKPEDLKGFTQCHFFAGIGGWSVALRQAGWSDDRPVWTGSCPCQPFSTAGKQKGTKDERHLWPIWFNLIRECKPSIIFGEQVSSAISHGWLDGVYSDLEAEGYSCGSAVLPACSVNAPHKRDRLWFVANAESQQDRGIFQPHTRPDIGTGSNMGHPEHNGRDGCQIAGSNEAPILGRKEGQNRPSQSSGTSDTATLPNGSVCDPILPGFEGHRGFEQKPIQEGRQGEKRHVAEAGFWGETEWLFCGDGKARRIPTTQSGICIVGNGIQHRAPLLHALGNAIVPQVAARFIQACM